MKSRLFKWTVSIAILALSSVVLAGPQRISAEGRRAFSPEIAIGNDGAVNVIWFDKGPTAERPPPKPRKPGEQSHISATDLYFSRSENGGDTWSEPLKINEEPGEIWGFSVSKPIIAVGPTGTIHLYYPANERLPATGKHVVSSRYRRSVDNGRTFSKPITVNKPPSSDISEILGEGLTFANSFGTMGVANDGTIITAWQNVANMMRHPGGTDGVVAISIDDGKSFEAEHVVLPGSRVCPCCQFTLAFGETNTYLGLRHIFDDGRDSAVAISKDGGHNFSVVRRLDFEKWDINGCPLKPTVLGVDGEKVYAAAFTGGEDPAGLYFTSSSDGGKTFDGRQQVHPEAVYSDAPALTVDADGRVRLIWHAKVTGDRRLFTSVANSSNKSLSAPVEVETPDGMSMLPASAVMADGTVFVVWQQDNEEVFVTQLPPASVGGK
jgi:hypothetical protein